METVTMTETLDGDRDRLREAMTDVGPFMRAAEFDEVTVDGDIVHITNHVGLATIELELVVVEDSDAVLTYEQRDGIFEEMVTRYTLTETDDGVEVEATTEFALQARLIGPVLDATVVSRQRRRELRAQFDYLATLS
ncbi:SRPBCC family protein [Haloarcula salinisoli]|uniref:SRPBCC family protein n=1 Tax=Haloarcula salinisoli TaxID=2487746 RepID=A0A8J7YG81_9EURY|nr:SRPBCC family protein [Halomicroarcula salinisoli]MBX0286378.1 SRPBCC family protein [Halomicroarcula salinisoli]MBX0302134.1 SRPBCC family protein [Halomicroarcula salinisoli]